ncbi:MAG: hypothetical protein DI530_08800 [Sphingomonas sp.]|uniref:hypothetical protein n=1 Tax=Sphingomonas sp. TaxID=28214 RepID=UPI000DBBBF4B|nr:hypothetical protein [Sphingomonas sp.]PZU79331.1 MAG: hypothetical protein DI530_08800 [Sphingomonas sp.]
MSKSTLADRLTRAALALPMAASLIGCSQPDAASQPAYARSTARPATATKPGPVATPASRVVRRTDFVKGGKPACDILFRYAGHEPETLFWEEPCKAVATRMIGRDELEATGTWARLNPFDRKFVAALPGGRVLYVEGSFTASIYPIGSNGLTYDIPVAD